jgi:predicted nucleotidyltransferase
VKQLPILKQIAEQQPQIEALCHQNHVARLELFGSATDDRFDSATSDLDFLVEFEINTPQGAADRFFGLKAGLNDLLGRTIDLIDLSTIKNPYFLEAIASSRLKIYGN